MKDQDLDILLAEYRQQDPSQSQIKKWQSAVRVERKGLLGSKSIVGFVAAGLVGFALGAAVFVLRPVENREQTDNMTIEYVVNKVN